MLMSKFEKVDAKGVAAILSNVLVVEKQYLLIFVAQKKNMYAILV